MSLMSSTGLKNSVLATGSLRSALDGGTIRIFAGTPPVDADAPEGGTLLCVISLNGTATGLTFETDAVAGALSKTASEVWSGINVATGIATHYRFVAPGDSGGSSVTQARLQGSVGMVRADLVLTNTSLAAGAPQTIDYYTATVL